MTRSREELIRELADEVGAPVPRLASVPAAALGWLAASAVFVALVTLATGPLRPGALDSLVTRPGFALELGVALAASAAAGVGLMRLRIPGRSSALRSLAPPLALLLAWKWLLGIEILARSGPFSTLGARPLCWLQVMAFSLPPLAAAVLVARRGAPLEPGSAGLLAGLAAGTLPALAMQLGCMDDPLHALLAHVGPVLPVAAAGALLGRLALRRV